MAGLKPHQLSPDDADLGSILPLLHASFAFMDDRIDPPSSLHRLTDDGIKTQAREHEIWAIGSPPIACMFLTVKPDCLYLGKLAVAANQQGQGLAAVLMNIAQERTRAFGMKSLELEVRIELSENHEFFRKFGFVETGRTAHSGYDRPTSITFRKEFPGP